MANSTLEQTLWAAADKLRGHPDAAYGQVLFIDARWLGMMVNRTRRELTDEEIGRIAGTYHAWRGQKPGFWPSDRIIPTDEKPGFSYADEPDFCKSAALAEIAAHDYVLTPGRYVGATDVEDDGEPFEEKMERLTNILRQQFSQSAKMGFYSLIPNTPTDQILY